MSEFLVIILLLGAFWVLAVVPRRRKLAQHAAMQDSVGAGDEIITAGGLHGTIRAVGDEDVQVEIAPGVVVTLDRRAVAAVATVEEVEAEPPAEAPETEHSTGLEEESPGPS